MDRRRCTAGRLIGHKQSALLSLIVVWEQRFGDNTQRLNGLQEISFEAGVSVVSLE
jgi:hypothetical protein